MSDEPIQPIAQADIVIPDPASDPLHETKPVGFGIVFPWGPPSPDDALDGTWYASPKTTSGSD